MLSSSTTTNRCASRGVERWGKGLESRFRLPLWPTEPIARLASINDQHRRKTNMLFVPVSANMRADPRFSRLTRDIGLADYWSRAQITPDHLS